MGSCCCRRKTKATREESSSKEDQMTLDDIQAAERVTRKRFTKDWKHASFRARKRQVVKVIDEKSTHSYVEISGGQKAYVPNDVLEDINSNSIEAPGLLPVWKFDSKTFVAKRECSDPIRDSEISVKEGECLTRLKAGKMTWKMKSQRNPSKIGLVPASMLRPKRFQDEQWYFGEMDNVRSCKLLLQKNLPEGTFLVRDSATQKGSLTLSVRVKTEEGKSDVLHFRIVSLKPESEDSMRYKIKNQQTECSNSQELIIHYTKNPLYTSKGLIVCLKNALINPVKEDADFPSLADIKITQSLIQKRDKLGEGNYGSVFKAIWTREEGKITVAVKESKTHDNEDGVKDMKREAEAMSKLRHSNIVTLYGYCYNKSEGSVMLICEFVSGGDLHTFLKESKEKGVMLSDVDTIYYALQVADGMRYLAEQKIVHRDLAARNVLLGENQVVKIADFGLARFVSEERIYEVQNDRKMPIKWTAPEALKDRAYTEKSDVWSYGIFLTELVTGGETPYAGIPTGDIQRRLEQGYRMTRDVLNCSEKIFLIMTSCWHKEPNYRPNFEDLFQSAQNLHMEEMTAQYPNYNQTQ